MQLKYRILQLKYRILHKKLSERYEIKNSKLGNIALQPWVYYRGS